LKNSRNAAGQTVTSPTARTHNKILGGNIMFRPTEQELKAYAEMKAESIVIRSYDKNGNSSDYRRKTTEPEKKIISTIIYGGLLAIRDGADKQSVKDACEYIGKLQIPEMNGYDTIYNPIDDYPEMK